MLVSFILRFTFDGFCQQIGELLRGTSQSRNTKPGQLKGQPFIVSGCAVIIKGQQNHNLHPGANNDPGNEILPPNITWGPGNGETDIASYTVQYRDVLGQWLDWTNPSGSAFTGEPGHTYVFRAQATDNLGIPGDWTNSEAFATAASITKYYSHGGSKVAMRKGDAIYYLHGDHLGSTSLTTDDSGDIIAESRYHPFGAERWQDGENVTDFGYTSQRESNFGLIDYNARFYSVSLGRFLSADTVVPGAENPQAWNRYSYVGNNPLKYNDPSGHCWGFASGLRNTFYATTCNNLDMATVIVTSPDATVGQKVGAGSYIGFQAGAHIGVAVGAVTAAVGCLTGAGTVVCAGAGAIATEASLDGDPTNEVVAAGNAISNAACADGDCGNEAKLGLNASRCRKEVRRNFRH